MRFKATNGWLLIEPLTRTDAEAWTLEVERVAPSLKVF